MILILTDWISDTMGLCCLARFARSGIINSWHSKFNVLTFCQIQYSESCLRNWEKASFYPIFIFPFFLFHKVP